MDEFKQLVTLVTYGVEGFGVAVIVVGSLVASGCGLLRLLRREAGDAIYQFYRRFVGRSIILGLEFLIAGDVIRTVLVTHTLSSVGVLALLVVIRAFLSFALDLEIEGRLPWQRPGAGGGR